MRTKLKFAALAAAILLAGALAAGTAAYRVVAPETGTVWSAGEVSVPSVFGQTAEEVLFYPWSLYDAETLYPLPVEDILLADGIEFFQYDTAADFVWEGSPSAGPTAAYEAQFTLDPGQEAAEAADSDSSIETVTVQIRPSSYGAADSVVALLLGNFALLRPVRLNVREMLEALEWNVPPDSSESSVQDLRLYLKDFPVQIYLHGTEEPAGKAVLNFAASDRNSNAFSFLIRPETERAVTDEEQTAALETVDAQLRQFFLSPNITDTELGVLLQDFLRYNDLYIMGTTGLRSIILSHLFDGFGRSMDEDGHWHEDVDFPPELWDEALSLDDFLSGIEAMGPLSVQLVNTQSQIVVLLTFESGEVLGAYYDIQLGCWSGMGYMS